MLLMLIYTNETTKGALASIEEEPKIVTGHVIIHQLNRDPGAMRSGDRELQV